MYQEHFGLASGLFDDGIAQGTEVYLGPRQKMASANLTIALTLRDSIAILTGVAGVGKTTVASYTLRSMATRLAFGWLGSVPLTPHELLEMLLTEFGFTAYKSSRVERLQIWRQFLNEMSLTETRVCILVENAERYDPDVLQALESLTAPDPNGCPGANVVLTSQVPLAEAIAAPALASLRQRTRLMYRLDALSAAEMREYMERKVAAAGGKLEALMAPGAVERLQAFSRGVIRVANNLCETALVTAATQNEPQLTASVVDVVALGLFGMVPSIPAEAEAAPTADGPAEAAPPTEPARLTESTGRAVASPHAEAEPDLQSDRGVEAEAAPPPGQAAAAAPSAEAEPDAADAGSLPERAANTAADESPTVDEAPTNDDAVGDAVGDAVDEGPAVDESPAVDEPKAVGEPATTDDPAPDLVSDALRADKGPPSLAPAAPNRPNVALAASPGPARAGGSAIAPATRATVGLARSGHSGPRQAPPPGSSAGSGMRAVGVAYGEAAAAAVLELEPEAADAPPDRLDEALADVPVLTDAFEMRSGDEARAAGADRALTVDEKPLSPEQTDAVLEIDIPDIPTLTDFIEFSEPGPEDEATPRPSDDGEPETEFGASLAGGLGATPRDDVDLDDAADDDGTQYRLAHLEALAHARALEEISNSMAETLFGDAELDALATTLAVSARTQSADAVEDTDEEDFEAAATGIRRLF
jgi:type II secretory pathway predicted ATPase ExeA